RLPRRDPHSRYAAILAWFSGPYETESRSCMAKPKTAYVCQNCGSTASKWAGQCADCGAWNTLVESTLAPARGGGRPAAVSAGTVRRLHEVDAESAPRVASGMPEMDRVLGG